MGYYDAIVCILIHRHLSAPIQKSSLIHSCTCYDQNHKNSSTSLTPLSQVYRGDADLSTSIEPTCVYNTPEVAAITFPDSDSKILKRDPGPGPNFFLFANQTLVQLQLPSMQPKFSNVFTMCFHLALTLYL